ncbi:MAG: ABC transporter substrate-binding protein [Anaerolineales bacterium]|nr:MAG: ABC transporter substrate-binding protein [Anaerolineales bacterium]
MIRKQNWILVITITAIFSLSLAACLPGKKAEDTHLRVGLLPILDILPFHVAEQKGYFEAEGIDVEFVPVKSAQERDALMQAGEIDGMLNDLISTGLFNRDSVQVKIVATARRGYPESPQFRVLAAPDSNITSAQDLKGVPIGISQNTVIEYITDRLLEAEGVSPDQIEVLEVSAIPVRFEQLMAGQIQAATLPDPLAQGAMAAGAKLIVDDSQYTQFSQSVLSFSTGAIESKPNTIKKFLNAWNQAVQDLNSNPGQFSDLLIEVGRVPESIQGSYQMPPFPTGEVPSQDEWQDVIDWLLEKELIDRPLPYTDTVLTDFAKP